MRFIRLINYEYNDESLKFEELAKYGYIFICIYMHIFYMHIYLTM